MCVCVREGGGGPNYENQKLASSFPEIKLYIDKRNNYMTRSATQSFSSVPFNKIYMYEEKSVKYNSVFGGKQLRKNFPNFSTELITHFMLIKLVKAHIFKKQKVFQDKMHCQNHFSFQPFVERSSNSVLFPPDFSPSHLSLHVSLVINFNLILSA